VASLPVFVKVAVPQLAMKIAAAQSKTFREINVEFILRSFQEPILGGLAFACQDSKSADLSGWKPIALMSILIPRYPPEAASAPFLELGTPNAATFMTIMTSAKRYSPNINPMEACIAKIQPSQIQCVFFNQMKTG